MKYRKYLNLKIFLIALGVVVVGGLVALAFQSPEPAEEVVETEELEMDEPVFEEEIAIDEEPIIGEKEESIVDEESEEPVVDDPKEEKEDKSEIAFVDAVTVPVIDSDASVGFGEDIGYDTEAMREAREKGDLVGCGDKIAYIEKEIEPTSRPLEAIYLELFKGDEIVKGTDYENPLSYHIKERSIETEKETYVIKPLEFDKVILEENKAKVYLVGEYATVGTCEPPRTEAVLKFASLQYPWIDNVEIYLNEEEVEFIHGGK